LNGTLLEMVRLLSQTGRTFAYVPQPAPPVAAKPAAPATETFSARDESLRGVSWKSPESWQAPGASSALGNWRSADPIADITRQLSGLASAAPAARAQASSAATTASAMSEMRPAMRATVPVGLGGEAGAVGAAMGHLDLAIASARRAQQAPDDRRSLSMSLAPRGMQIAGPHGYLIYVVAEQVPNAMYRAWAEIVKDGKRVERSGLVGPRFADAIDAEQYALEWAQQWIDRECATQAAAEPMSAARAPSASPPAYAPRQTARPLPALRHVPEPVGVNHCAPLHGPLNAFRGPLRRYPGEAAAATSASDSSSSASDRFPSTYTELISHAG
jgi:hypothetical protein